MSGIIRGIDIDFDGTQDRAAGFIGWFYYEFQEAVIGEGIVYEGKFVYEEKGKGVLSAGDAALDGKALTCRCSVGTTDGKVKGMELE